MRPLLVAVLAGYGVHLVWSAIAYRWAGLRLGPGDPSAPRDRDRLRRWLIQVGLDDLRPVEFLSVMAVVAAFGGAVAYAVFGSPLPALLAAGFAATAPIALHRNSRRRRLEQAQQAWPQIIEEIRILTSSVGRSIPQALFDAGRRAPDAMQTAFSAAHREWLITTDFARTIGVLKERLADPTADAACETLLVAHQVGGSDLDRRLEALAEDRVQDLNDRRDARAKQAGVRFARLFVLIVPFGMAIAGMSVGDGRAAYGEPSGQVLVMVAMVLVLVCWWWSGRFMRLPDEERVFDR